MGETILLAIVYKQILTFYYNVPSIVLVTKVRQSWKEKKLEDFKLKDEMCKVVGYFWKSLDEMVQVHFFTEILNLNIFFNELLKETREIFSNVSVTNFKV